MNIYPAELEMVLERCPGVAECAVIGGAHPRWGQTPVAVVVRAPDAELTDEKLLDFAGEHLASYKKPTRVLYVDEIPRTAGGKIARGRLREQLADSLV
jgi:acyl-CoA synthetase (AMP-forming)/AMP-acid ligase II